MPSVIKDDIKIPGLGPRPRELKDEPAAYRPPKPNKPFGWKKPEGKRIPGL